MVVSIDEKSGFCPGVVAAIQKAELELKNGSKVSSIGDIMHNREEMCRLKELGLEVVSLDQIDMLQNQTVLIRAHGEPPTTYARCNRENIRLVDATCPVVSRLQKRVVEAYGSMQNIGGQVVILGKHQHPEVIGLQGQVDDCIVIDSTKELLEKVDFDRPIYLLSQTTQSLELFNEVASIVRERYSGESDKNCVIKDTICRQVSNRYPHLASFSASHDVVIFVSGAESSNGKALYAVCKGSNSRSYKIESVDQIDSRWFDGVSSVGICGATSTPRWIMEQVRDFVVAQSL